MNFKTKKTALITGASSGIGLELSRVHAQSGGDLILVARSTDKLRQLQNELEKKFKIKVKILSKDLNKADTPQEIYNELKSKNIQIDYLINCAGFGGYGKFFERKWEDELSMIQVNVIALTHLTHLFLKDFVKRDSGKVLNVSSTAGKVPGPLQAVYFATKAYVTSFTNALYEETRKTNVSVTALLPGPTNTKFAISADMKSSPLFSKMASPKEVAQKGYQAMLDGRIELTTGLSLSKKILLSLAPLTPKSEVLKMARRSQEIKGS